MRNLGRNIVSISMTYGYMEQPDIRGALRELQRAVRSTSHPSAGSSRPTSPCFHVNQISVAETESDRRVEVREPRPRHRLDLHDLRLREQPDVRRPTRAPGAR